MSWAKRTASIEAGDTVAYSKQWLRSTGQMTGDAPFARGQVTGLVSLGSLVLAEIAWDKPDLPTRVNVKNLSRVNRGQVMDRDA